MLRWVKSLDEMIMIRNEKRKNISLYVYLYYMFIRLSLFNYVIIENSSYAHIHWDMFHTIWTITLHSLGVPRGHKLDTIASNPEQVFDTAYKDLRCFCTSHTKTMKRYQVIPYYISNKLCASPLPALRASRCFQNPKL